TFCLAVAAASSAVAAVREVAPGEPLQAAVEAAQPGDVLRLLPGEHAGPVVIDRALALIGEAGAALVGPGKGSVITLTAPDVRIEGLAIRGSGTDLPAMDSGILATRKAPRAVIRDNRFEGNLF